MKGDLIVPFQGYLDEKKNGVIINMKKYFSVAVVAVLAATVFFLDAACAISADNDFRCFKSVGLKNPLKLQFDFPSGNHDLGYVTYQNGSGRIPVKNINVKETREVPGGRPSEFKTEWQEVRPDNSGGKYIVISQGARVYEFKYIRKKDGKVFRFEEDIESSDKDGCDWNKK